MMDDGNGHVPAVSRGVVYQLDLMKMTATLVWEQYGAPPFPGFALGSTQFLANGNSLLCYGIIPPPFSPAPPHIQEFATDGGLVWDLSDTIPLTFPDGGLATFRDGGARPRDFGFYRAYHLDTVY